MCVCVCALSKCMYTRIQMGLNCMCIAICLCFSVSELSMPTGEWKGHQFPHQVHAPESIRKSNGQLQTKQQWHQINMIEGSRRKIVIKEGFRQEKNIHIGNGDSLYYRLRCLAPALPSKQRKRTRKKLGETGMLSKGSSRCSLLWSGF